MTTPRTCGTCGAALLEGAPAGQCPQCLLQFGLDAAANDGTDARAQPGVPFLRYFGDYELLEEIARGGMGVVFRARQVSLNRVVAVKMILAGPFAGKESVQRFRAEAEAAASLRHPNIVAIHEVGEHEGQPYFSMDYIQGRHLAEAVRDHPMPARRAAACIQTIAQAIQFAHDRGVLHRDLKPSNVLLDIFETPHITDFGLAKRLTNSELGTRNSELTLTGQVLGSPNYMPPEQASGKRATVGPASDVYSLGAILHHLLTGRAPFAAESLTDTLQQVLHNEPVSPRLLNPAVPVDLETICLKCLQKEPARRYAKASDLAEELARFLRGEPIRARPVGRAEQVWRWCRRQPALAALGGLALVLVVIVAVGAPIAVYRTNRARSEAVSARVEVERNLYAAEMRLASEAVHQGAFDHARQFLTNHVPVRGAEDMRGFEWRYLAHLVQESEPARTFQGLPAPAGLAPTLLFRSERFLYNQPDGLDSLKAWDMTTWGPVPISPPQQSASARWEWDLARGLAYAVDSAQCTVAIYKLPNFELGLTLHLPGPVSKIAMSYDRDIVAVAFHEDSSNRVLVWDLGRNARLATLGSFGAMISELVLSRDRTLLAARSRNGVVGIWDLSTLQSLPAPAGTTTGELVDFTPDNRLLVSPREIWDLAEKRAVPVERAWSQQGYYFGLSPDAMHFATGLYDLTIWDSRTLRVKAILHGHQGGLRGIAYSPNGKLVASASQDQSIRIWDIAAGREIGLAGGFGERMDNVEFSPDGQNLVSIGASGQVRVHRLSAVLHRSLFAQTDEFEGFSRLAVSPDQPLLATISVEGTLALWDRQTKGIVYTNHFPSSMTTYASLAFSPDGERVAWVTGEELRIMLLKTGEIRPTPIDGNRLVNTIAFSPDGRELAFGCGKKLKTYPLPSGPPQTFAVTDEDVCAVEYSPNGAFIAFADCRGAVTLRERAGGKRLSKVNAHFSPIADIKISPDGKLLAASSQNSTIDLWRLQPNGRLEGPSRSLRGHLGYVNALAFSPDGTRLVSTSGDKTLKIWDPHRGLELATLYGHGGMIGSVKFSTDGHALYSSGFDGEIHVWKAPRLAEIDLH